MFTERPQPFLVGVFLCFRATVTLRVHMKKTTGAVAVLAMTVACITGCSQQSPSGDAQANTASANSSQEFETLEDRFSYAYGADLAEKFKADGMKLNVALMADAMQAVLEGGERRMSSDEVASTLAVYREVYFKEKEAARAAAAIRNRKEGAAFLAENANKPGVIVTSSGLQYRIIEAGSGQSRPTEDDEVKIHYRAGFVDGTEFDSTYQRKEPFRVKAKQLIKGVTEALQLMPEGARWALYIPAELAYGEQGSDPYVGPDAVLIFEMHLLEIEQQPGVAGADSGQS